MARCSPMTLTVLMLLAPTAAGAPDFGPGEAAGAHSGLAAQRPTANVDFKVLVWYRRNDPLGTFKYEVYDVRHGEDTAKLDTWIKDVRTKYPAYIVTVRDIDLKHEKGKTDSLKVGSVIQRELMAAAGLAGIVVGPGSSRSPQNGLGTGLGSQFPGPNPSPRLNRQPGLPGVDRSFLNRTPTQFPIPVPYPRLPP